MSFIIFLWNRLLIYNFLVLTVAPLGQPVYGQKILNTDMPDKDLVLGITQTPEGFYWFGNSSGLYRFDGQQSNHLFIDDLDSDIQHDQFVSSNILPANNNLYWFSTYQALHALDPMTGEFTTFRVSLNDQTVEEAYNAFYFDPLREEILLKAGSSIFAFDTRSFTSRLLLEHSDANEIHLLEENNSLKFYGAPWWNSNGLEYFEYKSGAITNFSLIELPVMVKYAAPYTSDSIFLATPLGLQILTKTISTDDWKLETLIPGNSYNASISLDKKTIFAGMIGKGVFAFDLASKETKINWNSSSGLRSDEARILTPDKKGNLFVSHKFGGVDIITPPLSRFINFHKGWGDSPISDIITLGSERILGIDEKGSLCILDKGNENGWELTVPFLKSPPLTKAKFDCNIDSSIYIHGMNGFASLNSHLTLNFYSPLANSNYRGVLAFNGNNGLILSKQGILSIDSSQLSHPTPELPYGSGYFSNIIKISENRFLACYKQIELWDIVRKGDSWKVQSKYSLPGEALSAVTAFDTIYVGTSAGLLKFYNDSLSLIFNPIETIGNLWVNTLHKDNTGRLWLGTEQGLFCYYPKTGEHLFFSEADGIPDDWFIRANVISTDSTFTMATKTGLVTIDTRLADDKTSSNKTYLSDIWVNGIRQTDHSLYEPKPLDLDYQHNSVSFLPGMIELSSSSLSGFRYRLKGLEEEFTHSKATEVIRYPSIPPGDYSFEFVGVDKNGRFTKPIILPVSISPPFYLTWWFWTLCGLTFLGVFRYYNRRAVKRETIRQQAIQKEAARKDAEKLTRHQAVVTEQRRIVMELHDDLGGTLGSLFYTLDGYLLDKESGLPVSPDFELLKNTSGDAMKQLREVMKNNLAKEMSLPVFVRALTEKARAFAQASRLEWKLERDDFFPEVQLNDRQVHNATLILKEALQNIRKHSKATFFQLKVNVTGAASDRLTITLTDNGIGLQNNDVAQRTDGSGNGLINMQGRAEDIGGELTIGEASKGGTTLQLHLPLKEK